MPVAGRVLLTTSDSKTLRIQIALESNRHEGSTRIANKTFKLLDTGFSRNKQVGVLGWTQKDLTVLISEGRRRGSRGVESTNIIVNVGGVIISGMNGQAFQKHWYLAHTGSRVTSSLSSSP